MFKFYIYIYLALLNLKKYPLESINKHSKLNLYFKKIRAFFEPLWVSSGAAPAQVFCSCSVSLDFTDSLLCKILRHRNCFIKWSYLHIATIICSSKKTWPRVACNLQIHKFQITSSFFVVIYISLPFPPYELAYKHGCFPPYELACKNGSVEQGQENYTYFNTKSKWQKAIREQKERSILSGNLDSFYEILS